MTVVQNTRERPDLFMWIIGLTQLPLTHHPWKRVWKAEILITHVWVTFLSPCSVNYHQLLYLCNTTVCNSCAPQSSRYLTSHLRTTSQTLLPLSYHAVLQLMMNIMIWWQTHVLHQFSQLYITFTIGNWEDKEYCPSYK